MIHDFLDLRSSRNIKPKRYAVQYPHYPQAVLQKSRDAGILAICDICGQFPHKYRKYLYIFFHKRT